MNLKRIGSVIAWIIFNGLFMIFGIAGLFLKVKWSENIFVFFVWLIFILSLIEVSNKEIKKIVQERGRVIPEWVSMTYDIIIIGMLAAAGRFVYATMWFLQMCFDLTAHKKE